MPSKITAKDIHEVIFLCEKHLAFDFLEGKNKGRFLLTIFGENLEVKPDKPIFFSEI